MTDRNVYDAIASEALANGGGTYARDAFRPASLPNRYVVAVGKPWARVVDTYDAVSDRPLSDPLHSVWDISEALNELANLTRAWANTSAGAIGHNPRALGVWVADRRAYVDVVESYSHGGYALRLGRERGQLAIWDSLERVSIAVPLESVA